MIEMNQKIRGKTEWFRDAERKSLELSAKVPKAKLYVALCGAKPGFEEFEVVDGFVRVRTVTNPPGLVHVCRAANLEKADYLGVSRFSSGVVAEILVGKATTLWTLADDEKQLLLDAAFDAAALIKLRGHAGIFCPAFSNVSWDVVCGVSDNSVEFHLLDDLSRRIVPARLPIELSEADMKWMKMYWDSAFRLRESSGRFGLATNLAYTWNHTSDPRIAIVNVWAGLEALFGDETDRRVKEMVAERACDWVPFLTKDHVRDLYRQRCEAVHGRQLNRDEIWEAIIQSEFVLRQAIIKCIETRSTPLPDWS